MAKIIIAVPCMDQVQSEFAQTLAMASSYLVAQGHTINVVMVVDSLVASARRQLADFFATSDYDYIWWIDSDMWIPHDACQRLLERDKPFIGVNYRRRRIANPSFTAVKDGVEAVVSDDGPATEQVDAVGHGCLLIHRSVYEKIAPPYYIHVWNFNLNKEVGEDVFFCKAATEAGFEIWVDNDLSKEVAHIGTFHFRYDLSIK